MSDVSEPYDVAVVGYGPVGAVLAILLGQQGRRVVVLERHREPYPLPRAVHFDHEINRVLQACGVADAVSAIVEPAEVYDFLTADRRPLMRVGRIGLGPSGWPQSSMFSQPQLEQVLFDRVAELPSVDVRRGVRVTGLVEEGDVVRLEGEGIDQGTDAGEPVRAQYVVGCDGANSTIRELLGLAMVDKAFFYDWLIVDVIFEEPREYDPVNFQVCDPARPTTVVSGGPGRRRWEFMALPGETAEELDDEAMAWRLLEPWDARPDNATLERHAVYRFQARWLEEWRRGRVLLAGDAAHQTPPFAGQGMCAGIRDAVNLAWKLDLVLGDQAPDALLDTYGTERAPNMQAVIGVAMDMGALICVTDPEEAAARDEAFCAVFDDSVSEIPPFPAITEGVVLPGTPATGELFLQGVVEVGGDGAGNAGRRALLDDVAGAGWRLVTTTPVELAPELADWFAGIGGAVVSVALDADGGTEGGPIDVDGTYRSWFEGHGVVAALQRPDFAVFGTAAAVDDVDDLLAALRDALAAPAGR